MSLDYYFNRNVSNKKDEKPVDKSVRIRDDVEVLPGYFVKKQLYDKMYAHQKEGVKWLFSLHQQNKGAVLADDMGLGKTIQTIALLSSLFRYKHIKHVLIIAPTTLLINWKQEFKKWADFEMFITTIDGSVQANRRTQLIDSIQATEGILMMTYNLARSLQEELSSYRGRSFRWDYVILDEAHKIKNQTKTTKELNLLNSHLRLAITGTPVQNNLAELWSIYNFASQGTLLGTYATFKRIYEKPITTSRKKDASVREKVLGNKIAQSLRKIYEPYLLRRTKEQVFGIKLDGDQENACSAVGTGASSKEVDSLPPKYDWCVWIKMNKTQIKLYEDFLNSDEVKEILSNRVAVKSPLMQLLVLKKICDHPRLLSKNTFEKLIYEEDVDLDALNTVDVSVDVLLKESSKLSVLSQLLRILVDEKHKILLFSSSTKMLDIIEKVLKINKINFCRLDGQVTSNDKREQIVKNFKRNSSLSVMILTIQVGGVGLNLTEASRVIIYTPSWNSGTDSQAVDRSYRIGQKNPNVIVYRFMTATSVEEKIYSRQVFKDSLTRQTIGKENDPTRYFTSQDLYELFKVGDFTKSKVCDEFNDLHGTLEDKLLKELQATGKQDLTNEQQTVLKHKNYIINELSDVINISEHSLVFSKKTETLNTSDIDFAYLNNEVKTAKELLFKENLISSGSRNPDLENEYLSAKQRILTQKFGVEFLPLGQNFNQYREGKNKYEFKPPKPKSPVKVVIDDDDDIQFIDTSNNKILSTTSKAKESTQDMYSKLLSDDSDSSYNSLFSNDSSVNSADKSMNALSINTTSNTTTANNLTSHITINTTAATNNLNSPTTDAMSSNTTTNASITLNRSPNKSISSQRSSSNLSTNKSISSQRSPFKSPYEPFNHLASPAKSINDMNVNDLSFMNLSIMDTEDGKDKHNLSVMSNDISDLTNSFNSSVRIEERSPRNVYRTSSKEDSQFSSQSNSQSDSQNDLEKKDESDDSIIILD